jgi:UDP-N-acetylmuramate dehydrogenase
MFHLFKLRKRSFLLDRLPPLRGKLTENAALSKMTWMNVGGPAEVLFEPADEQDLALLISHHLNIPTTLLGAGSNVIIRDGGVPGLVIHLGKNFSYCKVNENNTIECGASLLVMELAKTAQKNGLSGFEFLCGIPGSVGGALRMNAGAYGAEIKDILVSIRLINQKGEIKTIPMDAEFFRYRQNLLPSGWIFVGATFKGTPKNAEEILETMAGYKEMREKNQPVGVKTCGSTFKNPEGLQAWRLIDKAGCRGMKIGGAEVSQKHCNFLINTGKATAGDVEALGETIRKKVLESSGISLEWEVLRIGIPLLKS